MLSVNAKIVGASIATLAAVSCLIFSGAAHAQGGGPIMVESGETKRIGLFGRTSCRRVTNNFSEPLMVPTFSADEYASGTWAFLRNLPTAVNVGVCQVICNPNRPSEVRRSNDGHVNSIIYSPKDDYWLLGMRQPGSFIETQSITSASANVLPLPRSDIYINDVVLHNNMEFITAHRTSGNAVTEGSFIYRRSGRGATFQQVLSLGSYSLNSLWSVNGVLFADAYSYASSGSFQKRLYWSANNGSSWSFHNFGTSITSLTNPVVSSLRKNIAGVAYRDGHYVAFLTPNSSGEGGSRSEVWRSPDLSTWSRIHRFTQNRTFVKVVDTGEAFVATMHDNNGNSNLGSRTTTSFFTMRSEDGVSWTNRTVLNFENHSNAEMAGFSQRMNSASVGEVVYIIYRPRTSNFDRELWQSTDDGVTWSRRWTMGGVYGAFHGIDIDLSRGIVGHPTNVGVNGTAWMAGSCAY